MSHADVHSIYDSPIGTLLLTAAHDGVLTGLHYPTSATCPPRTARGRSDRRPFRAVIKQLDAYFARDLTRFDTPYHLAGTMFQTTVWTALADIPYGTTTSYAQLAEHIGRPTATRAVGAANGRNPISIILPCHRVIGANGSLTGYGGGVETKKTLLDLEDSGRTL